MVPNISQSKNSQRLDLLSSQNLDTQDEEESFLWWELEIEKNRVLTPHPRHQVYRRKERYQG